MSRLGKRLKEPFSGDGFADMPAGYMRDANTLFATTSQLAADLAVAAATVALRAGGLFPGGPDGKTAYTVAFCLLGAISLIAAAEALRLRPEAGEAARQPSRAAA